MLMSNHIFNALNLTCFCKICFVKSERLIKNFCIEVHLASMMRAPSPRALRLTLWDPMRLGTPRAFLN